MRMSKRVNPNDRNTSNQPESKHSNNERTYFFATLTLFLHSPPLYSLQTPPLFLTQCKNPNKTPLRYSRSRDLSYVRVTGRCLPLLTRLLRKVSEGCVSHISGVSGCVVGGEDWVSVPLHTSLLNEKLCTHHQNIPNLIWCGWIKRKTRKQLKTELERKKIRNWMMATGFERMRFR